MLPTAAENYKSSLLPAIAVDVILQLFKELKAVILNSLLDTWFMLLLLVSTRIIASVDWILNLSLMVVALFYIVVPLTFNELLKVVILMILLFLKCLINHDIHHYQEHWN